MISSLILVSMGLKGKGFRFEKGNILWAEGKKSAHTPKITKGNQMGEQTGEQTGVLTLNIQLYYFVEKGVYRNKCCKRDMCLAYLQISIDLVVNGSLCGNRWINQK